MAEIDVKMMKIGKPMPGATLTQKKTKKSGTTKKSKTKSKK